MAFFLDQIFFKASWVPTSGKAADGSPDPQAFQSFLLIEIENRSRETLRDIRAAVLRKRKAYSGPLLGAWTWPRYPTPPEEKYNVHLSELRPGEVLSTSPFFEDKEGKIFYPIMQWDEEDYLWVIPHKLIATPPMGLPHEHERIDAAFFNRRFPMPAKIPPFRPDEARPFHHPANNNLFVFNMRS